MFKKLLGRSACVLFLALVASSANAGGYTPLAIAIIPPVQFPPSDFSIVGARVSALYGRHYAVYGFDLGIGNTTTNHFVGSAVSGLFSINGGDTTIVGIQAAGITNINTGKTQIYGIQLAAYNSNPAESSLLGFGIGLGNYSPHMHVMGAQLGIYNNAGTVSGFQIGLINTCETLHGLQIGLLNFHRKGLIGVSPILNIGF